MAVGGSQQETLDLGFVLLGTRQQGVPVIWCSLVDSISYHPASQVDGIEEKKKLYRFLIDIKSDIIIL
ncbi:unnamed protein product [Schistosoma margrebowiei]|uniref:Uncharacterized protein n=1 Tax=Schistosoma margrebowiei TaxID=48269 RepID=A0A183MXR7_9TREM|nr:unnamed protein product [Schistosoma margrebowiei]